MTSSHKLVASLCSLVLLLSACSDSSDTTSNTSTTEGAETTASTAPSSSTTVPSTTAAPTTMPPTSQTTTSSTAGTTTSEPDDTPRFDPTPFTETVGTFMTAVLAGEPSELWTGYPVRPEEVPATLDDLAARLDWWDDTVAIEVVAAELRPGFAIPVVVASSGANAATFVMSQPDLTQPPVVERLPEAIASSPAAGEIVTPTTTVWFDIISIEGGAWADVSSQAAKVVFDSDLTRVGVVIPDGVEGQAVITLVVSTPELPFATATVVNVEGSN